MKNVQIEAIKVGNVINVFISGKLQKKNCGSPKEADELFRIILKAKEDPSDENIKTIRCYLNEKLRVALEAGLEADLETGEVYLAGFNTPLPATLIKVIKEYNENGYPLDAIINFWKLLMINPDKRVRTSLFDFITTHDFVLTDKGYMVVYKAVYYKDGDKTERSFQEFVSNQYLHVKKDWSCSPNKYVVYKDTEAGTLAITKTETAESWNSDKNVEILGKLGDLFNSIFNTNDDVKVDEGNYKNMTKEEMREVASEYDSRKEFARGKGNIYTDMYTRSMKIELGKVVRMERKECDSDPAIDCSYGLHCGATKYVQTFANGASVILACLVNPANVVAVPDYDHSKMRVAEYFPFAFATYEDGKIDIIEQAYFENDYCTYEAEELEKQIANVQANELPIATAIGAEEEQRPMSELMKVLETRLFDIVE